VAFILGWRLPTHPLESEEIVHAALAHNPTTATLSMEAIRLLCEADALALWVRDRDTLAKAEGGRNGSWRVAPVSTQPDVECRAVKRCRALLEYRVLEGLSVCQ